MNAVIYFSCTGACERIARGLADRLNFPLTELNADSKAKILSGKYGDAVIVFPVHCQTYPTFMKDFFKRLNCERVSLVAAYGRVNAGNALYEAAKKLHSTVIAAAYIPAEHSYIKDGYISPAVPDEFIEKIFSRKPAEPLPKRRKTPFAGLFPSARSRAIIKLRRTGDCDGCGICESVCPMRAIKNGKPDGKCVRCLKCVAHCPRGALQIKKSRILTRYLKSAVKEDVILYL